MAGFGFGFGSHRSAELFAALDGPALPLVLPSPAWNGTAGSGFALEPAPVDPVRTTAKPALRLMVPPNQYYTEELVVGVLAAANNRGTLAENLGIDRIILHYEGTRHEIAAPSYYFMEDANGNVRKYPGWWAVLGKDARNGHARAYFEAIPQDPTMQRRVIGPFQFSPQATLYDAQLAITPSQPVIAGQRYQTIRDALEWCRLNTRNNPLVTITEPHPSGKYETGGTVNLPYYAQGYAHIRASVPVVLGKLVLDQSGNTTSRWWTRFHGMHFMGSNITIDMQHISELYNESFGLPDGGRAHWFDGVTITDLAGRYYLVRKSSKPMQNITNAGAWFTECTITNVTDPCSGANLIRGCRLHNGAKDAMNSSRCVVDTTVTDWTSIEWRTHVPAIRVQYTGAGATATLALSGSNGANNRVMTAKVGGAVVGTFTLQIGSAAWTAGTNYHCANVVAWLNSLPGWNATLLDDSRAAVFLGLDTGTSGGAFGDTDVKTAPRTLTTIFDHHPDIYQTAGANFQNGIVWGLRCWNNNVQSVILGQGVSDLLFVNCAFHIDGVNNYNSYLGWTHSHTVFAHCTWANQEFELRTQSAGSQKYEADAYCAVINCTAPAINYGGSTKVPDPDQTIVGSHVQAGSLPTPGEVGTTRGGTMASLFVNAPAGDFTPQGELLAARKVPGVPFDLRGFRRVGTAPAGALMRG